ncbi:adenosylmethionine--8-amino-7-oxononanoate transaminase [Candidatus Legionella polyplacis]|uniref:Adenosylmethionine-8-amino-7-oxononanoate aminotransferase n=1 Tax=Candidatus Legionella polyplacis TaxID=2005262 RepID=A0ABZ2H1S5_9GAMM
MLEDKNIIWHPFVQEKKESLSIFIKKGNGSYIYDNNNNAYLDLISSWWVNLHGHSHPKISEAIYKQSLILEHVIFSGFTHEPAIKLCKRLSEISSFSSFSKFFFSDNGSTAIEVSIKMAYQYWRNIGDYNRTLFLGFDGGYHGDTLGAMSVGVTSKFHDSFKDLCFSVFSIPFPYTYFGDLNVELKENNSIKILKNFLEFNHLKIVALIVEPLVQGASGMRMCRSVFIEKVVNLVRQYGILVIFDEVMTGFGRTGTYFAFEQTRIVPDFLCLSKGLTGGFLPLALTITTSMIYESFLDTSTKKLKTFYHGHSYTANPLGCAAAIASLELLFELNTMNSIKNISTLHIKMLNRLLEEHSDIISCVRSVGTISAFNINLNDDIMIKLKKIFLCYGLLLRPLNNVIYLMPPYSITSEELLLAYNKIEEIIVKVKNKKFIGICF